MKKQITIYLIGVVLGWYMGYQHLNKMNKIYNAPMTYGHIAIITAYSLTSWCGVIAFSVIKVTEFSFWSEPINTHSD